MNVSTKSKDTQIGKSFIEKFKKYSKSRIKLSLFRLRYESDGFRKCIIDKTYDHVIKNFAKNETQETVVASHSKTFLSCFEDTRPFDRIPMDKQDFEMATKAFVEIQKK